MFVIVNKLGREKFYLSKVDKTVSSSVWTFDNIWKVIVKKGKVSVRSEEVKPDTHDTFSYFPDIEKAKKYKTKQKAEEMIKEHPGLRFCKVEEI